MGIRLTERVPWRGLTWTLIAGASLASGCDRPTPATDAGIAVDAAGPRRVEVVVLPATANHDLDLLLVVDDSAGLADRQSALGAALPHLIQQLAADPRGLVDLHLGVISTDMGTSAQSGSPGPTIGTVGNGGCGGTGDAGDLQTSGASVNGAFLSDIRQADGSRVRNYTGDLATVAARMVELGAGGCGFEQPLAAMRAALSNNPLNAGFLRPDARLAVLVFADEDDCSASSPLLFSPDVITLGPLTSFRCFEHGVECTPDDPTTPGAKVGCEPRTSSPYVEGVDEFAAFLRGVKAGRPRAVSFGVLAGPRAPVEVELRAPPGGGAAQPALAASCSDMGSPGDEGAVPSVRLAAMADAFGTYGATHELCTADLSAQLREAGIAARRVVGDPCLEVDLGPQPDCEVVDLQDAAPDQAVTLPACSTAAGARPCYEWIVDPATCPNLTNQRLDVQRDTPPPPDTYTVVRCVI